MNNVVKVFLIGLVALAAARPALSMPEEFPTTTPLGVELKSSAYTFTTTDISVGTSESGLSYTRFYNSQLGWSSNFDATAERADVGTYVQLAIDFGNSRKNFKRTAVGGQYEAEDGGGATVISHLVGGREEFEYISPNGDVTYLALSNISTGCTSTTSTCRYHIDYVQRAGGERLEYSYEITPGSYYDTYALRSVNSSLGWNVSFSPTTVSGGTSTRTVQMVNLAEDYCPSVYEGQPYCNLSNWPKVTYASSPGLQTVTDSLGRVTRYYTSSHGITGVRRPSSPSANNITINYDSGGKVVSQVVAGAGTWTYGEGNPRTVRNPLNQIRKVHFGTVRPDWVEDALGRRTSFEYDSSNRLTRRIRPDGSEARYVYDARGHITEARAAAKAGTGLSDVVVSTASYPTSCSTSQWALCNLPIWTRDARGKQTDYNYSSDGRTLAMTSPASALGQPRPERRYQYVQLQAYVKNSSGTYVANGYPVWRLSQTSTCATQAAPGCVGTSDEIKTTYSYGSNGVANNRLLTQIAFDPSGLNRIEKRTYDRVGNRLTVDGPLVGTSDTTRTRYDSERRIIGSVAPDPDGNEVLKHSATRLTYDVDGFLVTTERGTVTSQTDAAWNTFVPIEKAITTYDVVGRAVKNSLMSGSSTAVVRQFSYDAANQLICTTQRMNSAVYSSLPSSACDIGIQGPNGPDRISKILYNAAGQRTVEVSAFSTPLQQNSVTTTYDANTGLVTTVSDALGNKTTYEHDGFARLYKVRLPGKTNGAVSSSTDYFQSNFDAYGRLASVRQRNGETISLTYDDLGRITVKNLPGTTANDIYYSYDLLGRALSARHGSPLGVGITSIIYDKAGAVTSQTSYGRTVSYLYDSAGRRSRMTWPDSFYVSYVYDTLSRPTQVRENGASSGLGLLAAYSYDNLGRLASIGRGNATSTTLAYDDLSRLVSLGQDLSGTSTDYTATFTYSPASQLLSRSSTNDSVYRWTGADDAEINTHNGLNQLSTFDGLTVQYDSNGNLSSDGTASYAYDSENRLTSVSGGASLSLSYDPSGRLRRTEVPGNTSTRADFLYDGIDVIGEYNSSGALAVRYVHGVGVDAPIVWYQGSGTSNKRWLHADERGSIIAVSNSSGVATTADTIVYDAYGDATTFSGSRFQYTGQMILPEAGLYYYKARMYSPNLGLFLQTDPIGYADGMNMYTYVGNDPINAIDPSGKSHIRTDETDVDIEGGIETEDRGDPGYGDREDQRDVIEEIVVTARRQQREPPEVDFDVLEFDDVSIDDPFGDDDSDGDSDGPKDCSNSGVGEYIKSIPTLNPTAHSLESIGQTYAHEFFVGLGISAAVGGNFVDGSGSYPRRVGTAIRSPAFLYTVGAISIYTSHRIEAAINNELLTTNSQQAIDARMSALAKVSERCGSGE